MPATSAASVLSILRGPASPEVWLSSLRAYLSSISQGILLSEVPEFIEVLTQVVRAYEEHGEAFVEPICDIISLIGTPYKKIRANEELACVETLAELIRVMMAAFGWNDQRLESITAQSLLSFTLAIGYDKPTGPSSKSKEENRAWKLHQAVLRHSNMIPVVLDLIQYYVNVFVHSSASSSASSATLLQQTLNKENIDAYTSDTNSNSALHAMTVAGIPRPSDSLINLCRVLRECAKDEQNALLLNSLKVAPICLDLLAQIVEIPGTAGTRQGASLTRDPLVHILFDIVSALLEKSVQVIKKDSLSVNMSELMDKHRHFNAVKQCGNMQSLTSLRILLHRCVTEAGSKADREFRNDVFSSVLLIASKEENKPYFAASGLLNLIIDIATALEGEYPLVANGAGGVNSTFPMSLFFTMPPCTADIELKMLSFCAIYTLSTGPYTTRYVIEKNNAFSLDDYGSKHHPFVQTKAKRGIMSPLLDLEEITDYPSCLLVIRNSAYVPTLLRYVRVRGQSETDYFDLGSLNTGTVGPHSAGFPPRETGKSMGDPSIRNGGTTQLKASNRVVGGVSPFLEEIPRRPSSSVLGQSSFGITEVQARRAMRHNHMQRYKLGYGWMDALTPQSRRTITLLCLRILALSAPTLGVQLLQSNVLECMSDILLSMNTSPAKKEQQRQDRRNHSIPTPFTKSTASFDPTGVDSAYEITMNISEMSHSSHLPPHPQNEDELASMSPFLSFSPDKSNPSNNRGFSDPNSSTMNAGSSKPNGIQSLSNTKRGGRPTRGVSSVNSSGRVDTASSIRSQWYGAPGDPKEGIPPDQNVFSTTREKLIPKVGGSKDGLLLAKPTAADLTSTLRRTRASFGNAAKSALDPSLNTLIPDRYDEAADMSHHSLGGEEEEYASASMSVEETESLPMYAEPGQKPDLPTLAPAFPTATPPEPVFVPDPSQLHGALCVLQALALIDCRPAGDVGLHVLLTPGVPTVIAPRDRLPDPVDLALGYAVRKDEEIEESRSCEVYSPKSSRVKKNNNHYQPEAKGNIRGGLAMILGQVQKKEIERIIPPSPNNVLTYKNVPNILPLGYHVCVTTVISGIFSSICKLIVNVRNQFSERTHESTGAMRGMSLFDDFLANPSMSGAHVGHPFEASMGSAASASQYAPNASMSGPTFLHSLVEGAPGALIDSFNFPKSSYISFSMVLEQAFFTAATILRPVADIHILLKATAEEFKIVQELQETFLPPVDSKKPNSTKKDAPGYKVRETLFSPQNSSTSHADTGFPLSPDASTSDIHAGLANGRGGAFAKSHVHRVPFPSLPLIFFEDTDELAQVKAVYQILTRGQDEFRQSGALSVVTRVLHMGPTVLQENSVGEKSGFINRARIITASIYLSRGAIIGNPRCESKFVARGGVDILLDVIEICPPVLRPIALTLLADLACNPISQWCIQTWKSKVTGMSAGVTLLELWRKEEERLGVVHDTSGAIVNLRRPLDGGDLEARQVSIFKSVVKPTAAAARNLVPGGRRSVLKTGGATLYTLHGEQEPEWKADVAAFRSLRRALQASEAWRIIAQPAEDEPLSRQVNSLDLRHKIFACLYGLGFNNVRRQLYHHFSMPFDDDIPESRAGTVHSTTAVANDGKRPVETPIPRIAGAIPLDDTQMQNSSFTDSLQSGHEGKLYELSQDEDMASDGGSPDASNRNADGSVDSKKAKARAKKFKYDASRTKASNERRKKILRYMAKLQGLQASDDSETEENPIAGNASVFESISNEGSIDATDSVESHDTKKQDSVDDNAMSEMHSQHTNQSPRSNADSLDSPTPGSLSYAGSSMGSKEHKDADEVSLRSMPARDLNNASYHGPHGEGKSQNPDDYDDEEAPNFTGNSADIIFSDLTHQQQISLQCVLEYPSLVFGAAWNDVEMRLQQVGIVPVASDEENLTYFMQQSLEAALRVRQRQLRIAQAAFVKEKEAEEEFFNNVRESRISEANSTMFRARSKAMPWIKDGRSYVGLSLEDRKAAQKIRSEMIASSFVGFKPMSSLVENAVKNTESNEEGESTCQV